MPHIRNEDLWSEIEDLPALSIQGDGETLTASQQKSWAHLEVLQKSGHFTALDLIHLKALIENVYDTGVTHGKEDQS